MALLVKFRDRLLSGLSVERALALHGPRVAAILGQRHQALFENPEEHFLQNMQTIRAILKASRERLTEAVRRHAEELADDGAYRSARDTSVAAVRDAIFSVRDTCGGMFDLKKLAIDFPNRVSGNPKLLLEQVDHLMEQIERPGLELPEPKIRNASIPAEDLVATLLEPADELRKAIEDIDREVKEAEVTQVEQDRAIEDWDVTFQWGARNTEGLFLMAGETKLAARVQPSRTRPGRTEQAPEVTPEDEDQIPDVASDASETPAEPDGGPAAP